MFHPRRYQPNAIKYSRRPVSKIRPALQRLEDRMTPATFQGLGDLPGGSGFSDARAVSPDGSVVVGGSNSSSGYEAFRWTQTGGMIGLGDLPGPPFYSYAFGVSAYGSVVVGAGNLNCTAPG